MLTYRSLAARSPWVFAETLGLHEEMQWEEVQARFRQIFTRVLAIDPYNASALNWMSWFSLDYDNDIEAAIVSQMHEVGQDEDGLDAGNRHADLAPNRACLLGDRPAVGEGFTWAPCRIGPASTNTLSRRARLASLQ